MQKINRRNNGKWRDQIIKPESKFCSTKTVMEMWLDFFFLPKEKEKIIDSEKEII